MLLVQRVENLRVGQELVQALAGIHPRLVGERQWELPYGAKRLDLFAVLVQPRLTMRRGGGFCGSGVVLCHDHSLHVFVGSGFEWTYRRCLPCLSSARSASGDGKNHCKNETMCNILLYVHCDGKGGAELSAIADNSALPSLP